jgi:hypothetical protein
MTQTEEQRKRLEVLQRRFVKMLFGKLSDDKLAAFRRWLGKKREKRADIAKSEE